MNVRTICIYFSVLVIFFFGCLNKGDGNTVKKNKTLNKPLDASVIMATTASREITEKAKYFRQAIDDRAAAVDVNSTVEKIRELETYLETLSDEERQAFASFWNDPPMRIWLQETTTKLQQDAQRKRKEGY